MPFQEQSAFVYIDELLDQKKPIYVRNVYKTRGAIVVTLNDGDRTHREILPNTKFPICLSNKATPNMLRNSRSLRQLLDVGALVLVPYEEAEAELSKEGVRDAVAKAYSNISTDSGDVRKFRSPTKVKDDDFDGPSVDDGGEVEEFSVDAAVKRILGGDEIVMDDDEDPGVSGKVKALVGSLVNRDMKSREVKSELMSLDLSKGDLAFIINDTRGIVQKYAKEQFADDYE